jgi:hypothetical protein
MGRVFEMSCRRRVFLITGLESEHTRHDCKTVLDPVSDLPEKHLLAGECSVEASILAFALDCHPQNVCRTLQKGQVMFDELFLGPAIDLQHTERLAVALQDDIHGAPDAVLHEQLRGSKPLLVLKVVGDDRLILPVRNAKPAGEARSPPIFAVPTMPGPHPTPARIRK